MANIDLDDLDGPTKVPARTSRFAPKNSKVRLKAEPAPELDSQSPLVDSIVAKTEQESSLPSAAPAAVVKMDVEAKSEGEEANVDRMEEDDDGDIVFREIDVFFSPRIDSATQLYVLQYPLRPCWRPYELDERCEEVRVNPTSAEVEVDLSVDVDSQNYDADVDPRVRMIKQTLSSSMKPTRTSSYAVGVLIGNKLHINPISAVVQLRPSMEHLKSGGSKKRTSVTSNAESTIKSEDIKDEKSAGSSKKQNKLPGTLNEHDNDLGESWVPLKYHSSKSDFSVRYMGKMAVDESSPIQFSMSSYDYVCSLCPCNDNIKPHGPPIRILLSLPLEERYKRWLREGPPANRFETLKHLAPHDSIEDVLAVLQKLAHLVQGLWVPKTSLLLEGSHGLEGLARNYILLLFSKNPVISYDEINIAGPRGEAMKGVLNILAIDRPSLRDWKFKEPPDTTFIKLYSNIVKEQEQAWEQVKKSLDEYRFFGGGRGQLSLKNSSKPEMANRHGALKNTSKGAATSSNGAVSKTPMSNETREALPKALQKLFQTYKVCSFQQICQRLREMAVSESTRPKGVAREAIAAANGVDAPQEELLEMISQVATNIHGIYVSKSSSDHPQYDPLRKIVIDLLIAEGPNAKLKKAAIVEAAKMQLKRDITPNEYQKVLNEICVSQGSAWVLKRGDGNPI